MEYKNIRVTKDAWKKLSHLSVEMDMSLGETIKYLYTFYVKVMAEK